LHEEGGSGAASAGASGGGGGGSGFNHIDAEAAAAFDPLSSGLSQTEKVFGRLMPIHSIAS